MTRLAKYTIALAALVTAAVTFDGGTALSPSARAQDQQFGYQITVRAVDSAKKVAHSRETWTKDKCEGKLGNINAVLDAVADTDPNSKMPDPVGIDDGLVAGVLQLLMQGARHIHVTCELPGAPA